MPHPELPPLAGRIAAIYEGLSRQEKLLADTVLAHVHDLPGYSATELASQANVSKATATRFFRRLGYAGFEAARLEARGMPEPRALPYAGSPLEALHPDAPALPAEHVVEAHRITEARNLAETFAALRAPDLVCAVDWLVGARKVWVVGFRDSYPLALYARAMLARVLDNVAVLPGPGASYAEDLIGLDQSHVMLAIGFRRRPRMFSALLKAAKEAGTPTILLVEPDVRGSQGCGTLVLRSWIAGSVFDSHAAALSVLNLLCSRVVRQLGPAGKARLHAAEQLHLLLRDLPDGKRGGPP